MSSLFLHLSESLETALEHPQAAHYSWSCFKCSTKLKYETRLYQHHPSLTLS